MAKVLVARGARGELVRKVQLALVSQGFDPQGADGKFGRDTEAAVRAFQQARSFEPTGRVDGGTWTILLGTRIPDTGAFAAAHRGLRRSRVHARAGKL
jgi:peptidoglycan hydrolase-like protein with peptidoglycan-binding domain